MRTAFMQTCKAVKLNSPHIDLVTEVREDQLYARALNESVPFYKWQEWIESTLHKQVLASLFQKKNKSKKSDLSSYFKKLVQRKGSSSSNQSAKPAKPQKVVTTPVKKPAEAVIKQSSG